MTQNTPTLSRRAVLKAFGAGSVAVAISGLSLATAGIAGAATARTSSPVVRSGWSRCPNCRDLFFSGPCPGAWCARQLASGS